MSFFATCLNLRRNLRAVWPPNAILYASSTYVHLRLLAGPFGQGFEMLFGIVIQNLNAVYAKGLYGSLNILQLLTRLLLMCTDFRHLHISPEKAVSKPPFRWAKDMTLSHTMPPLKLLPPAPLSLLPINGHF